MTNFPKPTNIATKLNVDPATVTCRVVAESELLLLEPIFKKLGWPLPNPDFAKAVVAEADGLILGFSIVQFLCHAEPMYVDPNTRGTGVAEKLVEAVVHYIEEDCHIDRWLAVAKPGSFAARLCESQGMDAVQGQLYAKMVKK